MQNSRMIDQLLANALGIMLFGFVAGQSQLAMAQLAAVTLSTGFSPNPTTMQGTGGGDRPARSVVNTRNTPTGPCVGYISESPHEELTLASNFAKLEVRVESDLDTTLVISGPGGIWCNDDSDGPNPAIAGAWLPGAYRIWVGAYRAGQAPDYTLFIQDQS